MNTRKTQPAGRYFSLRRIRRAYETHFGLPCPDNYQEAATAVLTALGQEAGTAFIQAQDGSTARTPCETITRTEARNEFAGYFATLRPSEAARELGHGADAAPDRETEWRHFLATKIAAGEAPAEASDWTL